MKTIWSTFLGRHAPHDDASEIGYGNALGIAQAVLDEEDLKRDASQRQLYQQAIDNSWAVGVGYPGSSYIKQQYNNIAHTTAFAYPAPYVGGAGSVVATTMHTVMIGGGRIIGLPSTVHPGSIGFPGHWVIDSNGHWISNTGQTAGSAGYFQPTNSIGINPSNLVENVPGSTTEFTLDEIEEAQEMIKELSHGQ